MNFFPFKLNVIANLCVCVCVCVASVCVHPLNKDISPAIIDTFFQCILQKMIGWVALKFVIALCWSLKCLKCDSQCLFLSYWNSCSACEMSYVLGNVLIDDHHVQKKIMCIYIHWDS